MNKSMIYLIAFILCILLQAGVAPAIAIGGCSPNFLLIPVLLVALRSGTGAGGIAGFFCGLLFDLMGNGTIGCMALVFTLTALVVGFLGAGLDLTAPLAVVLVAVVSAFFVEIAYAIAIVLTTADGGGAMNTILTYSLPTALYSTVFAAIALLVCGALLGYENSSTANQLGGQIGGSAGKMPRMKSRLK